MICSIIDGSTSLETGKASEAKKDEEVCQVIVVSCELN